MPVNVTRLVSASRMSILNPPTVTSWVDVNGFWRVTSKLPVEPGAAMASGMTMVIIAAARAVEAANRSRAVTRTPRIRPKPQRPQRRARSGRVVRTVFRIVMAVVHLVGRGMLHDAPREHNPGADPGQGRPGVPTPGSARM